MEAPWGALIERHGVPAAIRRFALFAAGQDRAANPAEAFGETEEQLDERLRRAALP